MAKKSKTTEKDLGIGKVRDLIEKLKHGPRVKTGILESAGTHAEAGVTVAQVAAWQEFGTERAPARPFMRYSALVLAQPMAVLSQKLLIEMILGKMSVDTACRALGEKAKSGIKKIIVDWDTPPNAPSTIRAKARKGGREKLATAAAKDKKSGMLGPGKFEATMSGFDNPLIDTAQMLNSVDYEVIKKK